MKDGLLIIDKPGGFTSHDVIAKLRRLLGTRKIGHTGTLDPFATGVLVILIGRATRLAQFQNESEKEYEAVLRFGFETDTGDPTGERREDGFENTVGPDELTSSLVESALSHFTGEIDQIPPMYSAKKIGGKRLYKLAREGKTVEREPVRVRISAIELLGEEGRTAEAVDLRIRVACSAGTYIRTLAEDIGRNVGIGCHLASLRRTRAGDFSISDAVTFEEIEAAAEDDRGRFIRQPAEAVAHLNPVVISEEEEKLVGHGREIPLKSPEITEAPVALITESGDLAAIGHPDEASGSIRPKIVMI